MVDYFLSDILPRIKQYRAPIIVNMSGSSVEEYGVLAKRLDVDGVAAVELNISCPNVREGGIAFGTNRDSATAVVREVKANTKNCYQLAPDNQTLMPNPTSKVLLMHTIMENIRTMRIC